MTHGRREGPPDDVSSHGAGIPAAGVVTLGWDATPAEAEAIRERWRQARTDDERRALLEELGATFEPFAR